MRNTMTLVTPDFVTLSLSSFSIITADGRGSGTSIMAKASTLVVTAGITLAITAGRELSR